GGDTTDDLFLLRRGLVALLHGTDVERVNYDSALNGGLTVEGLGGNDLFAVDDNSAITTLDGGLGNDTFQIGQLYGVDNGGVHTTRGWLSAGNSQPLLAEGGSGDDSFVVYSNHAALGLEGDDGNDTFTVRALALAQNNGQPLLVPGSNQVQYVVNAPVSIDGGNGLDTAVALGTEFADHIVVTDSEVDGAGLAVAYAGVEGLEIDGLESDDTFDVISTAPAVSTHVIGGLGSDTMNVAAGVNGAVVSNGVEGTAGGGSAGPVVIEESAGFTAVGEGGPADTFLVYLSQKPTANVYVTVSADALLLSQTPPAVAAVDYDRHVIIDGQSVLVPAHSIVLVFTPTAWAKSGPEAGGQTVSLIAGDDALAQGDRGAVVSSSVISQDTRFDAAFVRNVAVTVHDNDLPAIGVVQLGSGLTPDDTTEVVEGTATTEVADAFVVKLSSAPSGTVVVELRPADDRVVLTGPAGRFTTVTPRSAGTAGVYRVTLDQTNWSTGVQVGVHAFDDSVAQDPRYTSIALAVVPALTVAGFAAAVPARVDALVIDNDSPAPIGSHLLTNLRGPLAVDGGTTAADRSLHPAVLLPGESNAPLPQIAPQPPESQQVDTHGVYDDSSRQDKVGTLTATTLTGLGMSGALVFGSSAAGSTIEVLNILLGEGNDRLTITGTLVAGADLSTGVVAVHGGITTVHGGGGGDSITVTGGGGPASPLVIYGDTSQDGAWYSGGPSQAAIGDFGTKPFPNELGNGSAHVLLPLASPYRVAGDDVIDASASAGGIVAYGGAGNDTLTGSQAGDFLAGGSGDDTIAGRGGSDQIYGDNGINVNVITRELQIPWVDASVSSVRDTLAAGADALSGELGDDVIFGDYGVVTQDVFAGATVGNGYARSLSQLQRIQTTGRVRDISTVRSQDGGNDTILGGAGADRLFGGNGADTIAGDSEADVVFGDHGHLQYLAGAADVTVLHLAESISFADGGADTITAGAGDDIVAGGAGADTIDGGDGASIVFGDHGRVTGIENAGPNRPIDTRTGADAFQVPTLARVETINPAAGEFGGADRITTGTGRDIILGGAGGDTIVANNGETATTPDANNVVFGDYGFLDYVAAPDTSPFSLDRVWSSDEAFGGADNITTGARNDFVFGGAGGDAINAGKGSNIVFGDHGRITGTQSAV
ncbi:MAG: large repetitive protein, partial [Frankiaceae bacterium]|nr:large repetitive protein [Frankiaceae bacterium]